MIETVPVTNLRGERVDTFFILPFIDTILGMCMYFSPLSLVVTGITIAVAKLSNLDPHVLKIFIKDISACTIVH